MSQINVLLPFKEKFTKNMKSSVSITVEANFKESIFKNKITIFGQNINNPMLKDNFFGVKKTTIPFVSKNVHLAKRMCDEINRLNIEYPIIEIHNRPFLLKIIKKKVKKAKIILFFHNDPLEMKGSKSIKDRLYLISNCSSICFVSNYIKNQFLIDLNANTEKLHVLYNGVSLVSNIKHKKEKLITFVGRLVQEKGAHLFLEAVIKLHKKYKDWDFMVVGSTYLGTNSKTIYSEKIRALVLKLGSNVKFTGYLSYQKSQTVMQKSEILIVPSIWNEPFGLVVAEGMLCGCAIITSNKGAISEIIKDKGILLDNIDVKKITSSLELLINNNSLRQSFQKKAKDKFKFTANNSARALDNLRKKIMME